MRSKLARKCKKQSMVVEEQSLLPGLPDELVVAQVLPRIVWYQRPVMRAVSKAWLCSFRHPSIHAQASRRLLKQQGLLLGCVQISEDKQFRRNRAAYLDLQSSIGDNKNMTIAARSRWCPLPSLSVKDSDEWHSRRRCVCVDGSIYCWFDATQALFKLDIAAGYWEWQECSVWKIRDPSREHYPVLAGFGSKVYVFYGHDVLVYEAKELVGEKKNVPYFRQFFGDGLGMTRVGHEFLVMNRALVIRFDPLNLEFIVHPKRRWHPPIAPGEGDSLYCVRENGGICKLQVGEEMKIMWTVQPPTSGEIIGLAVVKHEIFVFTSPIIYFGASEYQENKLWKGNLHIDSIDQWSIVDIPFASSQFHYDDRSYPEFSLQYVGNNEEYSIFYEGF